MGKHPSQDVSSYSRRTSPATTASTVVSKSPSDPHSADALPAGSTSTVVVDPMTTHDPSVLRDHMDDTAEGEVADEPMPSVEAMSEHDGDAADSGDMSAVTATDTTAAGAPTSPRP